ncbi:MAG: tetratricopeptide repeat protein [Caldilineaceae bacterium]|nr:tetratricopeptide repeat protein [Caldilineaceae bacterium]
MRPRLLIVIAIGVIVVILIGLFTSNLLQQGTQPTASPQIAVSTQSPRSADGPSTTVSPISPLSALPTPADITEILTTSDQLFEAGEYEEAFASYSQAIEIGQGNLLWRAHTGRGNIYSAWRRQPEALEEYNRSLTYARTPITLVSRCNVHRLLHNYEQAIADCDEAASLDPDNPEIPVVLGSLFLDQGQLEEARQEIERAQILDPLLAQAPYVLSLIDLAEGSGQQAVDNLTRAIELSPDSAFFYWERGFLYLGLGEIEKARADMEMVLTVGDPRHDGDTMLKAGTQLQFLQGTGEPGE